MQSVTTSSGARRGGLFAKYVVSLVGLVVFVLAVNGALEIWFSYRQSRTALLATLSEKAEATARRIEQAMTELERQISWVTRASVATLDKRRDDYTQLMQQVPAITQLVLIDGAGQEALRLTRGGVAIGSGQDLSKDPQIRRTIEQGSSFGKAYLRGRRPMMTIAVAHAGRDPAVTIAEIDLQFLSQFVGDAQIGKIGSAFVVDGSGVVVASSAADRIGDEMAALPQVAAALKKGQTRGGGRDETQVTRAREHWKAYKAQGHEVTYWRQTDAGGWEKGA